MTNRVIGIEKTKVALTKAVAKVEAAAPGAEHAGAEIVAGQMRNRAPVRTGTLKNSIRAEGSAAVATVPYAIPVDRGTVNMAAQPFAEEGAKAAESEVEAAMASIFRAALGGR
jgi:HK97 gp10 family phage protein